MKFKLITAPSIEPITTANAKLHLHEDQSANDDYIDNLVKVARKLVENYTRRQLITATWELYLDNFDSDILIQKSPIQSITSVKYYNGSEVLTTINSDYYQLDNINEPPILKEVKDYYWPDTYDMNNAVVIRFIAGYGDAASSIPEPIVQAIYMIIGHLYENREDVVVGRQVNAMPKASEYLLNDYRVFRF